MYARTPKKAAATAMGFHNSSASHDATPRACNAADITITGWK